MPAARCPNVKFLPITACTPCTPFTRTRSTNPSAGICENSFVNDRTTSSSIPVASINDARRSTVVSSRGSLPGVSTSRGCRSNVTATERTPRSTGRLHRAREHGPMTQVHTVEEPDGDHRRPFRQRESLDPFHDPHARQRIENVLRRCLRVGARTKTARGDTVHLVGRRRARKTIVLLLCLPLTLFACGGQASDPVTSVLDDDAITVGSFNFPESEVLAEIYAQTLEARGSVSARVQRRASRAADPRVAARPGGAGPGVRGEPPGLLRR